MTLRDDKLEMLQNQVISKIRWGEEAEDVRLWLESKKGIGGAEADRIVERALRARSAAIRFRALWTLCFAGIGLLASGGYFLTFFVSRVVVVGRITVVMLALGVTSLYYVGRSLIRLLSGSTVGPVDQV
ncbi:MAG TPA: hypothetical protein VGO11_25595 [Chthoniobacteraceae bacterium]|jgi:hypothetical protein|nr:hypothetical protein [Chthoniobacteraceae bacterium]